MTIYQKVAENLQFISPEFYKDRFFKKLKNLSKENFLERNVEPELIWIKNTLPQNAVFIDIGANIGTFLFYLESKLLSQNIFAFEPNLKLFTRLERIFPEIDIYPVALSNKNGTAEFKIPIIKGKKINSCGTLQTDFLEKNEQKKLIENVEVMTFDHWCESKKLPKIDFIKIDVEGNEMETLYGAKKSIQQYKPLLMVEMEQRHHLRKLPDLVAEIEDWGYTAHFLNRSTFALQPIDKEFYIRQNLSKPANREEKINNIIFFPTPNN